MKVRVIDYQSFRNMSELVKFANANRIGKDDIIQIMEEMNYFYLVYHKEINGQIEGHK